LQYLDRAIGIHPKVKDQVQNMLNQIPTLEVVANNLQKFGHCDHSDLLGRRIRRKTGIGGSAGQFFTPSSSSSRESLGSASTISNTSHAGKGATVGSKVQSVRSHSGKLSTVGSHYGKVPAVGSHSTKPDESHPGKPTTMDKLLHAMHSAQSVVASEVKKEEYQKLKESYQQHKEIMENEAAVEHAFEVGMGFI